MTTDLRLTIGMPTLDDYDGVYFTLQALRLYHADVMPSIELLVVDNNPDVREMPTPGAQQTRPRWSRNRPHSQMLVHLSEHLYGRTFEAAARGGPGVPDLGKMTYVPMDSPRGTAAAKNRVFEAASAPLVLCIDSHVLLWPGSIRRLIDWYDANPHFTGLTQGPLVYDGLDTYSTHFHDEWGTDSMWGTWASAWRHRCGALLAPRPMPGGKVGFFAVAPGMTRHHHCPTCGVQFPDSLDWYRHENALRQLGLEELARNLDAEPFEIPACGMGAFACRKSDWLWYNANFRGFGGEEWYIHTKYRQAGRQTLCLPFLRWVHRFGRVSVPYALPWYGKARNYVIGHAELGLSLDPVHKAYVAKGLITPGEWQMLVSRPNDPPTSSPPPQLPARPQAEPAPVVRPPAPATLTEWVDQASRDNHPYRPHWKTVEPFLQGVDHITELGGRRRYSTPLLLGARPAHYLLVDPSPGSEMPELARLALGQTQVSVLPERSERVDHQLWNRVCLDGENKTDVLFIDTVASGEQLTGELLLFAPRVRRRIVLHGTASHGHHGEGGGEGLLPAVRRLVDGELPVLGRGEWFIAAHGGAGFGMTVLSRDPADRPARPITLWAPEGGPGAELKAILSGLGINPGATCDCNAKSAQMNIWGVEGCKANRNTIVGWLKDGAPRWGWGDWVKAAANAVVSGLVLKLNPLDPFPSLLDEAIRLAEAKEKAARAKEGTAA